MDDQASTKSHHDEVPQEQRTMGMLCHLLALSGLLGVPGGNVFGPLILWLVKKEQMPFVDDQGKESLNFQITSLIILFPSALVLGLISLTGIGLCLSIPVLMGLGIAWLVFVIMGCMNANNGERYRYPVNFRLIK